jgi:hypothetical protein
MSFLRLVPHEFSNDPFILDLINKHDSGELSVYKLEQQIYQYLKSKEVVQKPVFERASLSNKQLILVKELEEGLFLIVDLLF